MCTCLPLRPIFLVFLVSFLSIFTNEVAAQSVEADLATHDVAVEVDFAGTSVLLFGSIFNEGGETGGAPIDVIIVVRGPERSIKVRRKSRIAGIWVNTNSAAFEAVPGYYALVTNRPVSEIASSYELLDHGIGFNSLQSKLLLSSAGFSNPSGRDYSTALVRMMKRENLFQEHVDGVSFPGKHLFRAEFDLPSNVPLGLYTAETYVFRSGKLTDDSTTSLRIEKKGVERFIFTLAHSWPLVYGILAVLMAIIAGLGAAAIFRKK